MKKLILFFVALMATGLAKAQTVHSIPHHNLGNHFSQSSTFMELSDGNILGGVLLADMPPLMPLGYVLHKVNREPEFEISDTLFMADNEHLPWQLTAKDPQGKGNILAEFTSDFNNGNCYLRTRCFDDQLCFDTSEVIVHIADFEGNSGEPGLLLDPDGDIVLSYYDYYSPERSFIRVDLDGTIKHQAVISSMKIDPGADVGPIVFSESPLRYFYWGDYYNTSQMLDFVNCYLLDSLFNVVESYTLPRHSDFSPDYVDYKIDASATRLLGMDEGDFFVARSYTRPYSLVPQIEDDGVIVMKYDNSFNLLASRKFISEPYIQYVVYGARPIGLEKSKDGNIYFAYFTHRQNKLSQVSVVKMDNDLNVIWQRHCLEREYGRDYGRMIVLEDNSVAVMGINTIGTDSLDHTETFYFIVNDDYDALEEQGVIIRPYSFYPNPAQNELHLQYSPDVTPKQIELYDLQGRLVRTQCNGLESLNLQGLSAGQYVMKVTLENGKVFSDKVVKE